MTHDLTLRGWLLDRLDQMAELAPADGLSLLNLCTTTLTERGLTWRAALVPPSEPVTATQPAPALRAPLSPDPASQLAWLVGEIETLEDDKGAITADIREFYSAAKGHGFDTKILRLVIRIRRQDPRERAEQQELLDLYLEQLAAANPQPQPAGPTPTATNGTGGSEIGDELDAVQELLTEALASGSLSDWEDGFCRDLVEKLEQYGGATYVSERQWEILHRLEARYP